MTMFFTRTLLRSTVLSALGLFSALSAAGCRATIAAEPEVVWVDTVPADIESRPKVYYGGADAYLVEGRWYYRSPRGWAVYRSEPEELTRQRVIFERRRTREVPLYDRRRAPVRVERHPAYWR